MNQIAWFLLVFIVINLTQRSGGFKPSYVDKKRKLGSFSLQRLNSVALTREYSKNSELESLLVPQGISCESIPCIAHKLQKDPTLLLDAFCKTWDYVVVTSPEAASVVLGQWKKAGSPSHQVASIGKKTSSILKSGGLDPVFEASHSNAHTLATELPVAGQCTVLYPASSLANNEVETLLIGRGCQVTRIDAYHTEPAQWDQLQFHKAKQVDLVSFASPSAVRVWASRVGTDIPTICIGETTAVEAKRVGFKCVQFPIKPGLEAWANLIVQSMRQKQGFIKQ